MESRYSIIRVIHMLKVTNASKTYGGQKVLDGVSFVLNKGEKIGLLGPNGSGKSTLLKIASGIIVSDSGTVELGSGDKVAYVPQSLYPEQSETHTLCEYLTNWFGEIIQLLVDLDELSDGDANSDAYIETLDQLTRLNGFTAIAKLKKTLSEFGLAGLPWERDLSALSGGQLTRLALSCTFVSEPTILLLDEPSNNLDLPGLSWLIGFLRRPDFAALVVSHDRWLLDQSVTKVIEIDPHTHTVSDYEGNYSDYAIESRSRRQRQHEAHLRYEAEEKRLKGAIQIQRQWTESASRDRPHDGDKLLQGVRRDRATKSGGAAKRLRRKLDSLEHVEDVRTDEELRRAITKDTAKTRDIVIAENLSFNMGGNLVLCDVSISVRYEERVAILGRNGVGKTTLLRGIVGELEPTAGRITRGKVKIGYLPQEYLCGDSDLSVITYMRRYLKLSESEVRTFLAHFQFPGDTVFKRIGNLSFGERAKLKIAELTAQEPDCLVLDEPTNHMDVDSMEFIEEQLSTFTGAMVVVSHDRYFLERMGLTKCLLLTEKGLVEYHRLEDLLVSLEHEGGESLNAHR